jgi:hypothetical protein
MERAGGYGVKAKTSTERFVRSQQDFSACLPLGRPRRACSYGDDHLLINYVNHLTAHLRDQ